MSTFNNKMTAVAAEVRTIDGVNDTLSLDEMAAKLAAANEEIENQAAQIESIMTALEGKAAGGGDPILQNKTVTPTTSEQTITADSGYDGLETVTVNAMPTATQATPVITINTTNGLITATATQTAGYVTAGSKSATKQLAFQAAKTIIPGTTDQTAVAANYYTGGVVTVKGDANLVASNIVSGKSIFGVVGTATTGGGGNTDVEDSLVTKTISTYANDRVTSIGSYAFYNCTSLTSVNFPVAISIDDHAFYHCSNLTSVSFPKVTSIGSYAFYSCTSLTSVNFPVAISIDGYAFRYCSNLTSVSFPKVTRIGSWVFYYCSSLTEIYLTNSSVCVLQNSNAFSYTGIWSTKGSIFVPTSLVASYKAATNWVFFSNRIFGI